MNMNNDLLRVAKRRDSDENQRNVIAKAGLVMLAIIFGVLLAKGL